MDAHNYYSGKVCVVTGAGSGIGKATAALLVAEDAEVYALETSSRLPSRASPSTSRSI